MLTKLFLSSPTRMVKAKVYTLKDNTDAALLEIQTTGSLHPTKTREVTPVERTTIEKKVTRARELLSKTHQVLAFLKKEAEVVIGEISPYTMDELIERYSKLEDIYDTLKRYEEHRVGLNNRTTELSEQINILAAIGESHPGTTVQSLRYDGELIFSQTITASLDGHEAIEKALRDRFDTVLKAVDKQLGLVVFTVFGFVRSKNQLLNIARQFSAKTIELPESSSLVSEWVSDHRQKLKGLISQKEAVERDAQSYLAQKLNEVVLLRELLENELDRLKVLELAAESHFAAVVEGWIPLPEKDKLLVSLSRSVQNYWVEFEEAGEGDAPSKFDNLGAIRPFEMITKFFGTPEYNEWDPTPLLAYSFTLFFSFMFNDAVYGIILLLAGRFFLRKLFENPESQSFFMFRKFVYTIGVGTTLGGVLSGTYAGDMPQLLGIKVQPILRFFSDPVELMVVSMIVGLVHINIAHFVRFLRSTKAKNTVAAIGVMAFYSAQVFGIPYVLKAVLRYNLPSFGYVPGIVLLYSAISSLVIYIFCKVKMEGAFALFLWVFDLAALLGDILSYTRLAGVGLAGFYLGSAFNLLSKLAFRMAYGILPNAVGIVLAMAFGTAIFSIGHLINIGLGVLGAFVHSLRLCAVEFLPKFFSGNGTDFAPMTLRIDRKIVIRP